MPQTFSHEPWTQVLQRYVDDQGMVDYRGLADDREILDQYVKAVETYSPESHPNLFPTRQDALAFYINAYNAQVFKGVLARGPEEKSVWRGLVSGLEFFGRMKIVVGGRTTNLRNLENKDIREAFGEPRIHAALNCASIGCPRLPREAFLPEQLEEQLDAAMTEWVSSSYHVKVDDGARTVFLNKIFDWFKDDFLTYERSAGVRSPSLIGYVNRFRDSASQIPADYKVKFLPYDKAVNKQP